MSKSKNRTPEQLYNSGKARIERDAYYTEGWLTEILIRRLSVEGLRVLEPACGRGDMVKVLEENGAKVTASDIDLKPWLLGKRPVKRLFKADFLKEPPASYGTQDAIITNPPYFKHEGVSMAERFIRRAFEYSNPRYIAMLCRSTFNTGKRRRDLWTPKFHFAYEIVITERPRWDWCWPEEDQGESTPFHPYSWFVWDRNWKGPSTQFFEAR